MSKGDDTLIGTIRKTDLLGILESIYFIRPDLAEGLTAVAKATCLATQFSEPQKLSVVVEGAVKRLVGGNDEN